jgi:hypothetical protein
MDEIVEVLHGDVVVVVALRDPVDQPSRLVFEGFSY